MMEFSWIIFLSVGITCFVMHELGHFLVLGSYIGFKNTKITFQYNKGWELVVNQKSPLLDLTLDRVKRNKIYIAGIIFQIVYIGCVGALTNWLYLFWIAVAIIVSQDDLRKLEGEKVAS